MTEVSTGFAYAPNAAIYVPGASVTGSSNGTVTHDPISEFVKA